MQDVFAYKPVAPLHLEIDPKYIETYATVFDALKLDEQTPQMTIVYDATRSVWTVVLTNFETDGLLEFLANVHMELPQENENTEVVEWDHSDPIGTGPGEEDAGEPSDDFLGVSDGPVEDEDELDTTESITQPDGSKKVFKLKSGKTVQRSGAISVEED